MIVNTKTTLKYVMEIFDEEIKYVGIPEVCGRQEKLQV